MAETHSASDPTGIVRLNPLELPDWDTRVATLPGAGFFHSAAWARVLHATYGYQPHYLGSPGAGALHLLLPLMEVDSWLTGRRGISLPFTDSLEPLGSDSDSCHQLFQSARQLGRDRHWKYLEMRGGKKWPPDAQTATSFLYHTLRLEAGERALFTACDDPVRRAIRKAEKNNLKVEFSQSLPAMEAFYQLLCLTRRRHGVPPQPFSFFAAIQRHVLSANQGWIVLVSEGSMPVAGAVFFHFGRQVIYKYGASDETRQHLRANNLVMWRAIQRYAGEGFASLDFGRTSLGNAGLRQFKCSWGTEEHTLDYFRFDLRQERFVTHPDTATGWYNRFFQALPIPLARLAGAALYRHIA